MNIKPKIVIFRDMGRFQFATGAISDRTEIAFSFLFFSFWLIIWSGDSIMGDRVSIQFIKPFRFILGIDYKETEKHLL